MMRRSLFEDYAPAQPPPSRLRPNVFARIAQFSFTYSVVVVLAWIAISAGLLAIGWFAYKQRPQQVLSFSTTSISADNLAILGENFPNLNALIALNITNSDAVKLRLDRDALIDRLHEDNKNFNVVFSPGAGAYYDSHAILYHPLDEVKARVAYAQSLRPLFSAIATAPTTESLSTLVNEVSASIELGRDPQGLDELFSEAAKSVQALLQGTERQVDWRRVAGLNIEPQQTSALIFVLPKPASVATAVSTINEIVDALPKADGTTTIVDQPPRSPPTLVVLGSNQIVPGLIMMGVFLIFVSLIVLGDITLAAMIAVPVICAEAVLIGLIAFTMPDKLNTLWPLTIAVAIVTIQLSARYAFSTLAVLRLARGAESAVMLAAQKQGGGIGLMALASIVSWASCLFLFDHDFMLIGGVMIATVFIAFTSVLSVTPAIVGLMRSLPNWRAEEWLVPLYSLVFGNRTWWMARRVLSIASIGLALYGFWSAPTFFANTEPQSDDTNVNLVARSTSEAESILNKLKSVPQAQAARWIGAFLPQQVDEKRAELMKLKDSFQSITPLLPQVSATLREQISTLQDSLLAIANSQATRPELRQAAQDFRRSMELLTSTSSDKELRAFENRIFGSFNVLSDEATTLATLDKPSLETLDPQLRALFLSPSNIYRIEVAPIQGTTNTTLARTLAGQNLPVAHPALVAEDTAKKQRQKYLIALATLAAAMIFMLLVATREAAGFFSSVFVATIVVGVMGTIAFSLKSQPSPENLLALIMILAFNLNLVASAFLKWSFRKGDVPDALYSIEAWMPAFLVGAILAPCVLLNLQPFAGYLIPLATGMAGITIVIALLLRPITIFLRGHRVN